MARSITYGLILAGSTLLVFALLAELVLRLAFPVAAQVYTYDENRHYRFLPGASKMHRHHPANGGGGHRFHISPDGFRGSSPAKPKSARRIAVYGDSFVAADYSPLESSFCHQLGHQLGPAWEVVNAGVPGYGLDQSLLRMEEETPQLQPDALLIVICAENDSIDLLRNKLFLPNPKGGLTPTGSQLEPRLRDSLLPHPLHPRSSLLLKTGIRTLRHLRARQEKPADPQAEVLRLQNNAQNLYDEWIKHGDTTVHLIIADFYDVDLVLTPNSEPAAFKRQLTTAILRRMRQLADAHGIPLHAVIVPSAIDVVPGYDDAFTKGLRTRPEFDPTALSRFYNDILQQTKIPFLDLSTPFKEHGASSLYFARYDPHWNNAGQALGAELVASFLTPTDDAPPNTRTAQKKDGSPGSPGSPGAPTL